MNQKSMLRGLSTISFYADNMEEAKKWYSELLGMEPYFEVPGYFEFRLGDYQHELGIIDKKYAPHQSENTGGAIAYWHVDDVRAVFEKLLALGATEYEPMNERGEGFITASVVDPFGNIIGIMYNQHYLDTLSSKKTQEDHGDQ